MRKPIIIGITGGMGSGKSTLSNKLRAEGYSVYDSDVEARRLQNDHPIIRKQLTELFGEDIYTEHGLNRASLAKLVFGKQELLAQLNAIVHPVVAEDFKAWIKIHEPDKFLFIESAILFESGFNVFTNKVIFMTASEEVRIARVLKRDQISLEQVMARMSHQLSDKLKLNETDFIIHTDDNLPMDDKMMIILKKLNEEFEN
ncbi:MAG: dephospho-CoA kinase [Paludibacter sp.]|jgi:dephospho-CoA kinase|nr:dephospho-CoA kinase [Paludibacter sp.]